MPIMTGLQLSTNLRSLNSNKKLKILLVSADEVFESEGIVDFILEKPISLDKIQEN